MTARFYNRIDTRAGSSRPSLVGFSIPHTSAGLNSTSFNPKNPGCFSVKPDEYNHRKDSISVGLIGFAYQLANS